MAFTDIELAEHIKVLEDSFWSRRRPPLQLRDKVREGQRFTDRSVELFSFAPRSIIPGSTPRNPSPKFVTSPACAFGAGELFQG